MRLGRMSLIALSAAGALVVASSPASALGHKGDSRQITALRDGKTGSTASIGPHSEAVPEIEAGALLGAVALVAGGFVMLHRRFR